MEVNRDHYYALAGAIVRRAMQDYQFVCKCRKRHTRYESYSREELERFFRSEWFDLLCPVDGEVLMQMIRDKCDGNTKNSKRKHR